LDGEISPMSLSFENKARMVCTYVLCIIISLLMFPLLGHRLSLWFTQRKRTGHNPPRGPSARWWVLTTANAAKTNGLTYLPKYGGARDNKFLITHLMTDQCCLTSAIARRSALTAGLSSSSQYVCIFFLLPLSH
jgi:hypothetical protein